MSIFLNKSLKQILESNKCIIVCNECVFRIYGLFLATLEQNFLKINLASFTSLYTNAGHTFVWIYGDLNYVGNRQVITAPPVSTLSNLVWFGVSF